MSLKSIGFYASVKWEGEDELYDNYFSFGEYSPATGTDGLGVDDEKVFFYPRRDEVDSLFVYAYEGWVIIPNSITYVYDPKEVL